MRKPGKLNSEKLRKMNLLIQANAEQAAIIRKLNVDLHGRNNKVRELEIRFEPSILRVYHKEKHDDYTVTTITVSKPEAWLMCAHSQGGFWHVEDKGNGGYFVPWHSVIYIELA